VSPAAAELEAQVGARASRGLSLASVPPRLRTHPTYRRAELVVLEVAGAEVVDGSFERTSRWFREAPATYRAWLEESVPNEVWEDRRAVSVTERETAGEDLADVDPPLLGDSFALLEETHTVNDPEHDCVTRDDPRDADGELLRAWMVLPLERVVGVEESCAPSAADLAWLHEDLRLRRAALPLYDLSPEVITEDPNHPFSTRTCDNCGDQSVTHLDHCGRALCLPCWRKQGARAFPEVGRTLVSFLKLAESRFPLPPPCARSEHEHGGRWPDLRGVAVDLRAVGVRPLVRFVTLTIRSGPDLAERVRVLLDSFARLRACRFWSSRVFGCIARVELTWSPTEGWHAHLHIAEAGRFLPDRPPGPFQEPRLVRRTTPLKRPPSLDRLPEYYRWAFPDGAPAYLREFEPESNLKDEWIHATGGEGSVLDVRTADVRGDPLAFAVELSKYVAKPVATASDGSRVELKDWPEDVRLELARFVRGSTRVRWYCAAHSTPGHQSTRRRAPWQEFDRQGKELGGCPPDPSECVTDDGCLGEYRVESVGARRLRFYGVLRDIHVEAEDDGSLEADAVLRERCGKDRLRAPWEIARLLLAGWALPAGAVWPLPFIHAHKSAARRWGTAAFDGSPRWSWPGSGAEGPPAETGPPEK